MPRSDAHDIDPLVLAELDAIDATLAGEPVSPEHAELAELALLLADTAPRPATGFTRDLDRRVARRFEPPPSPGGAGAGVSGRGALGSRLTSRRLPRWAAGPAAALVAASVAVVVIVSGGGFGSATNTNTGTTPRYLNSPGPVVLNATSGAARHAPSEAAHGTAATSTPAPIAGTGGREIASASIALSTANQHVDQVSQEVFNVVADQHGTVSSSQITAASGGDGGGYASFTLSIPTANLQAAMTQLSRLRYAAVASRTDGTQNVSGQYGRDQRALAQAQALRTSLLKQLQAATSQTAIDAIQAQLKSANAQIASAQAALASLRHRISDSVVSVQINQDGLPIVTPLHHAQAGGFTIGRAGHDALRVLVVSAGVALIALAVLVPLTLLAALLAWIGVTLRQRRRERALDAS